LGPHTGYAAGVLGPLILAAIGTGTVTAPSISTGTFGVAPQDVGVAFATVTVGQQFGASVGTEALGLDLPARSGDPLSRPRSPGVRTIKTFGAPGPVARITVIR
jgi:hypothetical protein